MQNYKDIINYSIIYKLKQKISDACIIFNNLVRKENIEKRESNYYEVYTLQYKQDLNNLQELRDRCQHIADECNRIMLDINRYHIKQYYLNPDELSEYEDLDKYQAQFPKTQEEKIEDDNIDEW